ncbi:unnamed protein product, partial [Laminaria digitata]
MLVSCPVDTLVRPGVVWRAFARSRAEELPEPFLITFLPWLSSVSLFSCLGLFPTISSHRGISRYCMDGRRPDRLFFGTDWSEGTPVARFFVVFCVTFVADAFREAFGKAF